jgi:transcriptional regulator with XRE-family HTH domain
LSREFFSERLRVARKEQKLTLIQLAERVHSTQAHLSRLETGDRIPSGPLIKALAQALGVREEWLLEGEEPMYEEQDTADIDDEMRLAEAYVDKALESAGVEVSLAERSRLIKDYLSKLKGLQRDFQTVLREDKKGDAARTQAKTVINAHIGEVKGDFVGRDKITTHRHTSKTINTPPPESITESQSREIHNYLIRIGELESERLGAKAYGVVMNQFKNKYGITSYKNLHSALFQDAASYLQKRIKTLENSLLKNGKQPISRDDYIRNIQTICKKELKWTDPIRREEMIKRRGKASLKDFTMAELEDFYKFVGQKAQKAKSKR